MGFADYLKKNNPEEYKKIGGSTSSSASSVKKSSGGFKDYLKKNNPEGYKKTATGIENITILSGDDINNWWRSAYELAEDTSNYYKTNSKRYEFKNGYEDYAYKIQSTLESGQSVLDYLDKNKDSIVGYEDIRKRVKSVLDIFGEFDSAYTSAGEFYSSFETEDDYNAYLDSEKKREEQGKFDLTAGTKEVEDLEGRYKTAQDAYDIITRYQTSTGDPNAHPEYRKAWSDFRLALGSHGSIEELKNELDDKKKYLREATWVQLPQDAANAADFDAYAAKGAAIENPTFDEALGGFAWGTWRPFGKDVENKVTFTRDNYDKYLKADAEASAGGGVSQDIYQINDLYMEMNDDEVAIYNYYLAKDNENGTNHAEEYLKSIEQTLNYRKAHSTVEMLPDDILSSYIFAFGAGVNQFGEGFENLFLGDQDYVVQDSTQIAAGMIREELADKGAQLPEWMGGGSLAQMGFDAIQSTGNMLPSVLVSYVPVVGQALGAVSMGASAAGNAYAEMINLGYDRDQARGYSLLVGASEAGLSYLLGGISKLGGKISGKVIAKIVDKIDNGFARAAIQLGGNMLSEFTEEGLQEILTPVFKNIAFGEDIDIDIGEAFYSGLLGALTAGVMEGGGTISENVGHYVAGKDIKSLDGGVERLKSLGSTFAADTVAHQLAGRITEDTGAYSIGRLFHEVGATLTEQNQSEIVKSLVRKGVTERDAKVMAEAMAAVVEGETFSEKQKAMLEGNKPLAKTFVDVIINPNSTVNQRTQSLEELAYDVAMQRSKKTPETTQAAAGEEAKTSEGESSTEVETAPEVDYSVSLEGKTLDKDANEIEIEGVTMEQMEDGSYQKVFKLKNDKTIKAEDVSWGTEEEGLIYTAAMKMDASPEATWNIIKNFKPADGISAQVYAADAALAYNYGLIGYEQGVSKLSIPTEQAMVAYYQGRHDAAAKTEAKVAHREAAAKAAKAKPESTEKTAQTKQGKKIIFEGFKYNSKTATQAQRASMAGIEMINKMTSALEIHVVRSYVDKTTGARMMVVNGKAVEAPNGYFVTGTNKIYIDINAGARGEGSMLYTLGHEVAHFIAEKNPEDFKVIGDFVIEQFMKLNVPLDEMLAAKVADIKADYEAEGKALPSEARLYEMAYEEIVCEAMAKMLADPTSYEKLAELKKQNLTAWQKLGEAIRKILEKFKKLIGVYSNFEYSLPEEAKLVDKLGKEVYEQLQDLYLKAFVKADENAERIGGRDIQEFAAAKNTNGETLFQHRAMEADEKKYRTMLKEWGGISDAEITTLFNTIDSAMEIIKENLEVLDYAWEADIDDRAFSPVKPNSDSLYQVSLDFSTLCRKRLLQQAVQARLQEALNKPLSREEGIAIRDALIALQEEGRQIEVACALCYVESARMKSPAQIEKFLKNREAVIKDFFASKDGGDMKAKIKQAELEARERLGVGNASLKSLPKKEADQIRAAKKAAKASYVPTAEQQKLIDLAKGMTVSDFTSPEGLENLAKNHRDLFDAYTSYIRNATKSKGIENDTWWRAGDSASISDTLIANMNRENGLRSQSWSDFQVIHLLDYIAATIELSTRNAKEQAYTKVPDFVELMGNTGVMINLSLIPTRDFNGKLEYDGTEGMGYEDAKRLRDKYHATAGTICIGVDNAQIKLLLGDITIDYVIPYHKSGLAKHLRKAMHIPTWTEYELYQSESKLSDKEAAAQAKKYGVTLLAKNDKNYQKHTAFSEWFDIREAQQIAKMENSNPSDKALQKQLGVMYGGYMAMQNAANNYLKLCAERGLAPKFSHEKADFTGEANYWKLLIDRKMVDNVTGEVIEQQSIKPIFDEGEILRILNDELERYPKVKADQEYAERKVTEKFLSGDIKGGMSAKAIADVMKTPVDNVTTTNIMAASTELERRNQKRDADYMDAVNRGDMETAQRMVDEAAKAAGYTVRAYHGTNDFGFTVPDTSFSDDGLSFFATDSIEVAETYSGSGNVKKISDIDPDKRSIDELFEEYQDRVTRFISTANKIAGVYNYMDYTDDKLEGLLNDAEYGLISDQDIHSELLEYADEIAGDLYERELDYEPDLDEEDFFDSKEVQDLYEAMSQIEVTLKEIANHEDEGFGNYQLYANPEGLFEIDAKGKSWNQIPFDQYDPYGLTPVVNTRQLANYAADMGYTGVKISNVFDDGGRSRNHQLTPATVYIFFNPQAQVKSADPVTYDDAGNVIPLSQRFNPENPDIRYQKRDTTKPDTFYSHMGKVIDGIKTEKVGAGGVIPYLKGRGVKDEEIKWSGIEEFLKGKKSLTKQELQEFAAASMIQIEETTIDYTETPMTEERKERIAALEKKRDAIVDKLKAEWKRIVGEDLVLQNVGAGLDSAIDNKIIDFNLERKRASFEGRLLEKLRKDLRAVIEKNDDFGFDSWKDALRSIHRHRRSFAEDNDMAAADKAVIVKYCNALNAYNELPNAISDEDTKTLRDIAYEANKFNNDIGRVKLEHYDDEKMPRWGSYKLDGGKNYREIVFRMPDSTYTNDAMYTHWGEEFGMQGVLAHARVQDFEMGLEKMLFIEEIQSDWHNEGQKEGYKGSLDLAKRDIYANQNGITRINGETVPVWTFVDDDTGIELGRVVARTEEEAMSKLDPSKLNGISELENVLPPDAPFRNYHEFVLKRLIREAAENGYDSIGWTTAATQSERWSDKYAEGYRIEYDQDMPKFLNKYGKKWGTKVQRDNLPDGTAIWSMDITDSMRESVMTEGQPLFQKRSRRGMLADALETVAQTDAEKRKVADYKTKIDMLYEEERKLHDIGKQLNDLYFTKGKRDDKKIDDLQFEKAQIENRINTLDKQLLDLEASKPLKDVLEREKKMAYKRAEQKGKDALAELRKEKNQKIKKIIEHNSEMRRRSVEGRKKTEMRHKIKNVVDDLNQLLLRGTKDKHVVIGLQKAVAEALDIVNLDTVSAEARIAKLEEDLVKAKTPEKMSEIVRKIDNVQLMGSRMDGRISKLKTAYAEIKNSDDPLVANAYDEVIANCIEATAKKVGDTPLRDMTLEQLQDVYDMYKMVYTRVQNANKSFKMKRNDTISTLANRVMAEVHKVGGSKNLVPKIFRGIKEYWWNNFKPTYAFSAIGSDTLAEVYKNVRAGEDTWAVDINEAKDVFESISKKHGYNDWNFKEKHSFKSTTGVDFELSLEQMLSLYAYSKREQADKHLEKGGFVFDSAIEVTKKKRGIPLKYNVNTSTAHKISKEAMQGIIAKLTPEQKAFVDEMQRYLSTDMGAKGNEISLAMYGVKLFKEKFYFPLKSARQFMFEQNEVAGEVRVKNSGFSKETVVNASNPIILSDFTDVWARHVNEMSMYHAFVLPLEDFNRVFNYKTPISEKMDTESVKMYIQNAYGTQAVDYVSQLIKDLNGGVRSDPRESLGKKLISGFKKASVMASWSVVFQQPSAVARALALIDMKYFDFNPKIIQHRKLWNEVKKYAPVAIIKEMGRFDTDTGLSTADYIKGKKTAMEKVDDFLSKPAAYADELTWCHIWTAVKRETKAKHKDLSVTSEEFLKLAGERFTEVVVKTQVYDSILARSANMRSKSVFMNMVTSFMAEPTTSINMVTDAILQGKRGNKRYARKAVAAVYASIILNSALASLVYAARDDDEDETFLEKYVGSFTTEMIDGINPLTYLPFIKDVWSIAQGYDVERSDMSIVSDVMSSFQNVMKVVETDTTDMDDEELAAHQKKVREAILGSADGIASLLGVPLKNVRRDINGGINLYKTFTNGLETNKTSMKDEVVESVKGATPVWGWMQDKAKEDKLYEAIMNGDTAYRKRIESQYDSPKAVTSAIRKALKENDPRIEEAALAQINGDPSERVRISRQIIADGFNVNDVIAAVNSKISDLDKGEDTESAEKVKGFYDADDFMTELLNGDQASVNAAKQDIINTKVANGKTEEEAEASFESSVRNAAREKFKEGKISETKAIDILTTYCGNDAEEAEKKVGEWQFELDHPELDGKITYTQYQRWETDGKPRGVSLELFTDVAEFRDDGTSGETRDQEEVAAYIDSITNDVAIKDALWCCFWKESTLYKKAPWHN